MFLLQIFHDIFDGFSLQFKLKFLISQIIKLFIFIIKKNVQFFQLFKGNFYYRKSRI